MKHCLIMLLWLSPFLHKAITPQIYVGVQNVSTVPLRQNPAATGLLLWPLPKGMSAQIQVIQPIARDSVKPLLRFAVDIRIR